MAGNPLDTTTAIEHNKVQDFCFFINCFKTHHAATHLQSQFYIIIIFSILLCPILPLPCQIPLLQSIIHTPSTPSMLNQHNRSIFFHPFLTSTKTIILLPCSTTTINYSSPMLNQHNQSIFFHPQPPQSIILLPCSTSIINHSSSMLNQRNQSFFFHAQPAQSIIVLPCSTSTINHSSSILDQHEQSFFFHAQPAQSIILLPCSTSTINHSSSMIE